MLVTGYYNDGIYLDGYLTSSTISGNNINNLIANNTNEGSLAGILVNLASQTVTANSIIISNNTISGLVNTYNAETQSTGIYLNSQSSGTSGIEISNNSISNISAYGVATVASGNMLLNGTGICVWAGLGYNIYSNSINLASNQTTAAQSAAIYISGGQYDGHSFSHWNGNPYDEGWGSTPSQLTIENNIFADNESTGSVYGIYTDGANTAFTSIDYNDYYVASPATSYANISGTNETTVSGIATAFTGNTHSVIVAPNFVSATDLDLLNYDNFCLASGVSGTGITQDIHGTTRTIPVFGG